MTSRINKNHQKEGRNITEWISACYHHRKLLVGTCVKVTGKSVVIDIVIWPKILIIIVCGVKFLGIRQKL